MQSPIQTKNSKESSVICFSREDKAVAGLGPAAHWRYVRSPRSGTNAVCHRSCTFGTVRPPEKKFRNPVAEEIDSIVWTAYGKVLRVVRSSVSSKPDLHFARRHPQLSQKTLTNFRKALRLLVFVIFLGFGEPLGFRCGK